MAHTIYLGTFSKHENSTAQPNITGWASFDVNFKEGADISAPEITLSASLSSVIDFNYAKMLDRYYWIRRKNAFRNGLIVMQLEIDVLATYKTEIGNADLYILRSSNAYTSGMKDTYYPMTGEIVRNQYEIRAAVSNTFSSGVYVVNVMGKNDATGTSTLYQFTPVQFSELVRHLMAITDGFDLTDIVDQIKNAVFKPMEYINSVMWFPEAFASSPVAAADLYIGYWPGNVACSRITDPVLHLNSGAAYTPTVFKHPQAATRGSYLNFAPYTQYTIDFPPFGIIPLDTTQLKEQTYVSIDLYVDALTGVGVLTGTSIGSETATHARLFNISAQYGVQLPLLGNGYSGNVAGILTTAASIAGAVATGGAATMAGAAAAGLGTMENAIIGSSSTIGSQGSILAHNQARHLDARFFLIADEDNARNGRPLCEVYKPSVLGGFMIAQKGDIDAAIPLPEHDIIKSFLETGFFYE